MEGPHIAVSVHCRNDIPYTITVCRDSIEIAGPMRGFPQVDLFLDDKAAELLASKLWELIAARVRTRHRVLSGQDDVVSIPQEPLL